MSKSRRTMLATTALALWAAAAPAGAQTGAPAKPQVADVGGTEDERLVPMAANGAGGGKHIRPFGGSIVPDAGRLRTFAGPVMGTAGRLRTFGGDAPAGEVQAAAGRLRTFAGRLRTFSSDVTPGGAGDAFFWGALAPRSGTLSAMAGRLRTFDTSYDLQSESVRAAAGRLRTFAGRLRTFEEGSTDYKSLDDAFLSLVNDTKTQWGETIQVQTGQGFEQAFANKMLDKYGIRPGDPRSLAGLDEFGIEMFLLDWYDNLMLFSGRDQVDHWMSAINWSPALTQSLGYGADTKIGILDYGVGGYESGNNYVSWAGHQNTSAVSHGSAVASLIMAKHDGRGVMGIAPNVKVIGYNPFDATDSAGWDDISAGVRYMLANGASVINASLGVPGVVLDSGWNDIFKDDWISKEAKKRVFVLAAGNEGVVHAKDQQVDWNFDRNPNIIIVGSVDPNGTISAFSNQPGEGKFKKLGGNDPLGTDLLRSRFIVAPGEFLLVSDGQGGVTRMSGTSFATPLVSGTIALIHDRWPWLAEKPKDTVNIVLGSARDVGEAGVDGVYGRGMLDVQAALSPLSWSNLRWQVSSKGTAARDVKPEDILKTKASTISLWEANSVYFTVFEDTGDSYRDFSIPLSTKLIGKTVGTSGEQFNAYLQSRFQSWFNTGRTCTGEGRGGCDKNVGGFAERYLTARMPNVAGLETVAYASPRAYRPGLRQSGAPFDTALALSSAEHGFGLTVGSGDGVAFTGRQGFALQSDHDVLTGGADPFLGLASGGGYASVDLKIGDRFTVSSGVSRQDEKLDRTRLGMAERRVLGGMDSYRAGAGTLTATYRATGKLTASLGYTLLDEATGLLGMRSADQSDFSDGSVTDAATLGADYSVAPGLTLSATGTMGRTRAGDRRQGIAVSSGGLVSSAWQLAVAKEGVLGRADRLRVTLAQPLHVEHGSIDVTGQAVVDRLTGEIGDVTQTTSLRTGQRRFVAEAMYGRTVLDGAAEVNLFGRADLRADDRTQPSVTLGGNLRLGF